VFLLLLALLTALSSARAEVVRDSMYSPALNQMRLVDVYLPPNYHSGSALYPVIYFLHGLGATPDDYAGPMEIVLDALIGGGNIQPVIAALPDGNCGPFGGSMYTNSVLYGAFEDFIAQDIVSHVEGNYRVLAGRENRAIMGHSMGGHGAMKAAFKHAENYYAAVSLSGFVSVSPYDFWRQQVLLENGGHGPYNPDRGFFTLASYTAAGAFTPHLGNPPYNVDFPLDDSGNVVQSVFREWQMAMPGYLAQLYPNVSTLAIYFDCGQQDELGFFPMNEYFDAQLDSLGIAHRFEPFIGDHTSQLILRGMLAFMYLDSVRNSLAAHPETVPLPTQITLRQNYPNPFNSSTRIEFFLPRAGEVELSIFDLLGRETVQLANGSLPAGNHTINWNASSLPSGIYFCRLSFAGQSQVRRMVLLR
jgi:S-formylglutathione hydrolase FrmB